MRGGISFIAIRVGAPVNLYNLMLIAMMMVKIDHNDYDLNHDHVDHNDDDRNHDYVDNDSKDEVQLAINKIQTDFKTNISSYSEEERIQFMKIDHNYH